jgi:hypothetical protein
MMMWKISASIIKNMKICMTCSGVMSRKEAHPWAPVVGYSRGIHAESWQFMENKKTIMASLVSGFQKESRNLK